jgi:hypothetical protein
MTAILAYHFNYYTYWQYEVNIIPLDVMYYIRGRKYNIFMYPSYLHQPKGRGLFDDDFSTEYTVHTHGAEREDDCEL